VVSSNDEPMRRGLPKATVFDFLYTANLRGSAVNLPIETSHLEAIRSGFDNLQVISKLFLSAVFMLIVFRECFGFLTSSRLVRRAVQKQGCEVASNQ
jgi:hypothetical protein